MGTLLCLAGYSQSFIGYGYDNYSGVNSLLLNPGMLGTSGAFPLAGSPGFHYVPSALRLLGISSYVAAHQR